MAGLLAAAPKTERVGRYPKHAFHFQEIPFTIQPFCLAPVLPGETLSNLWFEARVVTDPIASPIIGWKKEYYFFYIKVTDMLSDQIRDMFINPQNTDLTATMGAATNDSAYYQAKGGMDYNWRCMKAVVEAYFRDEGEAWDHAKTDYNVPIAQIRDTYFMDSLVDKDDMPEGPAIAGATDAGDLDRMMDAFEMLRELGLRQMTYEDFLRSNGIAIPNKDENKPELLARFSDFQYPSNTIDPVTGSPTSACSWVFKNGMKDGKFFKEPGFIWGCSVTRPKVYFSGLAGSMASFMGRAWDWMPNYLAAMPETSLKNFAGDTGPLGDRTSAPDGYFLDMRDLLLYGDQYVNIDNWDGTPNLVGAHHLLPLPDNSFNFKYPTQEMCTSFFKDPEEATSVKTDGYVSLTIQGTQRDHTPGNPANM